MNSKLSPWVAFSLAMLVLFIHNYRLQPWTLDDAFISFRYAENLAAGKGLVYNPGEYVEGYTNFLWVLLLSAGRFLGLNTILCAKVLGSAFSLGVLALTAAMHRVVPGADRRTSTIATLSLGTCGIFTAWAMSGMEVALVAFWSVLAVYLHFMSVGEAGKSRWAVLSGVCCALAAMSRPEAGLVFGTLFLSRLWDDGRRRRLWFVYFGAVFVMIYAPYFAWRYWYYGWLLPNTFYVKVGSNWEQAVRGYNYVGRFLTVAGLFAAAGVTAALTGRAKKGEAYGGDVFALLLALHTAYVIAVGGDCMPAFRFFATVMPFFAMLTALYLSNHTGHGWRLFAAVSLLIGYNLLHLTMNNTLGRDMMGDKVWNRGRESGLWLRDHYPPETVIATNTAGSIPYYSGFTAIDMLGLNDAAIAHRNIPSLGKGFAGHEKGDGKYVLSRKPDIIMFGSASGAEKPHFVSDREMYKTPEFERWYVFKRIPNVNGRALQLYERRKADAQGNPIIEKEAPPKNAPAPPKNTP